ncbi:CapA family protein [Paeniglutamicibacter sp. NPDC012692]|uniref:CapA family protein n=1 Tax=Paeniglutamicibacter sp. NPDC012692 TaxID=3364388 RepID=UPI003685CE5B
MHERPADSVRAGRILAALPALALSLALGACSVAPAQPSQVATPTSAAQTPAAPTTTPVTDAAGPSAASTTGTQVQESDAPDPPAKTSADASCPGEECIEVAVAGDILLHPALWEQATRDGKGKLDFEPLLGGIAPFLAEADLSLCNLETPLAPKGGPYQGYPMFTVPQEIVPALKAVGYDGCTTASNHSMDGGVQGVIRTLDALKDAGMVSTGSYRSAGDAGKPLLTQVGGAKVAVIAGTYSLNGIAEDAPWRVDGIDKASLVARAKAARAAGADIVLAAIHDGTEYTDRPTAGQKELYRALADSGEFDFVYSHHTHSVLPIEKRGDTWIVYGLGNSVAKHATKTVLNREGITVNMQFVRTAAGWEPGKLRWAPHVMAEAPDRWCALPAPAGSQCTDKPGDAASLKRTTSTVHAFGADTDGAGPWEPAAP